MIYSLWQPDGGYAYYESKKRHFIGDDVPVRMPERRSRIGIPAQDVGHEMPRDAKYVGYGDHPVGFMAPMARPSKGFGASDGMIRKEDHMLAVLLVGVLVVGAVFFTREAT